MKTLKTLVVKVIREVLAFRYVVCSPRWNQETVEAIRRGETWNGK